MQSFHAMGVVVKPASAETYTLFFQSTNVALAGGPAGAVLAVDRKNRWVVLDEIGAVSTAHPHVALPAILHEGDKIRVAFARGRASRHGRILEVGLLA